MKMRFYSGYGISVDKINLIGADDDRFKRFIESQPTVRNQLIEWEKEKLRSDDHAAATDAYETKIDSGLCALYMNFGNNNDDIHGFDGLIGMVLSASVGFSLVTSQDCTGE